MASHKKFSSWGGLAARWLRCWPLCALPVLAQPAVPGCPMGDCGMGQAAAYGELVIGRVEHVPSPEEMRRVYRWGMASGAWRAFDDDEEDYVRRNAMLLVSAGPAGRAEYLMIHLPRAEYEAVPIEVGDLVHSVPLWSSHDAEGRKAPSRFSVFSTCVAVMCRAVDPACFSEYTSGYFRKADGVQISLRSGEGIAGGARIDRISYRPLPSD